MGSHLSQPPCCLRLNIILVSCFKYVTALDCLDQSLLLTHIDLCRITSQEKQQLEENWVKPFAETAKLSFVKAAAESYWSCERMNKVRVLD